MQVPLASETFTRPEEHCLLKQTAVKKAEKPYICMFIMYILCSYLCVCPLKIISHTVNSLAAFYPLN